MLTAKTLLVLSYIFKKEVSESKATFGRLSPTYVGLALFPDYLRQNYGLLIKKDY